MVVSRSGIPWTPRWNHRVGNRDWNRYRFAPSVDDTEADEKEAAESLARFEANLRLIERGIIDPPGEDAEVGIYIVSGGKLTGRPTQTPRVKHATLAELFDSYLAAYPKGLKEANTWKTEKIGLADTPLASTQCETIRGSLL